ncbi:NAD-dependent epimerase/dehydratase family protein [Yaniella halotolerans]|uniref:NAD-dependent epimerase/dehydratase family protein n=1 Tax=Yaniella halotolerans TaxID=225453 RepID=UPI0003B36F53|nr:NAD-dependent epimerase/dehydratase family protein [Yaniella halotolerans]
MTEQIQHSTQKHVVIGAGPAGRATARYLSLQNHSVILASRSGKDPTIRGVERIAVDATDAPALVRVVNGADAMYNCMNPTSYARWDAEWPPIHAALMHTAQVTGAVLVTLSNLYMYGPQRDATPMTPATPENPQDEKGRIRSRMDRETLQAHRDGTLRAVTVRASDFLGPEIGDNGHGTRNIPAIAQERRAYILGSADQPHSWTDIDDVAATLATVATSPETHGRVWFAPTNAPVTQRELANQIAAVLEAPEPTISKLPLGLMKVMGIVSPLIREISSIAYQFKGPWVIDSSETTQALGIRPTDWDSVIRRAAQGNIDGAPAAL